MQVMRLSDTDADGLRRLLARFALGLELATTGDRIPGSHWGESEAGLVADVLHARPDTPIHSILHETCHYICMTPERRGALHTDAGGDDVEENAVCYLQILLADHVVGFGRARQYADMDAWGYSFRLGSAQRWFEEDAQDARDWLLSQGLINQDEQPTWRLRR